MKKKLPLIIFIIFCVVLSLSYGIGSYFVNYALAPHITNEEVQEKINESELNQEELMIYKNSLKETQKGLEFQKKTKPMNVSSFDHILLQSQYYQNKDCLLYTSLKSSSHSVSICGVFCGKIAGNRNGFRRTMMSQ